MPEFDVEPIEGEEAMDSSEKAGLWLSRIDEAKKSFREWNDICDGIDDVYARLSEFAFQGRDREFNLFWSNMQVLGPSIYARPPVPVVTPRFNDRRPLHRTSAELLERCAIVDFERSDINSVLLSIRDDLTVTSRGTAWVRYLNKEDSPRSTEMVVSEWLYRRDFLHGPGRTWSEVEWVARRGWMDREDFQDRFDVDAFEFDDLINECKRNVTEDYVYDENGGKVGVWEVWSKTDKRVYWVMEGYNAFLDDDEPPLKLECFFPCPKPAYATTKRNTLLPVPEYLQYRDQLETINRLTNKIHELSNFLKVVGFYPGGVSDVSDVVQQALSELTDGQNMYPIGDWASVASTGGRMLEWLPTDQIAATIVQCVELRRQLIDDVYQIMGLSDIMRGSTDPKETKGAQQLKVQSGSVRIRDKQSEMVRIARDIIAIAAEIIAEHFSKETMEDMAQMNLPTDAEIRKQIKDIEKDAKDRLSNLEDEARETIEAAQQAVQQQMEQLGQQAQQAMSDPQLQSDPQAMEAAQAQFMQQQQSIQQEIAVQQEQAQAQFAEQQQEIIGQAQSEVAKLAESVTIDQVFSFLRDQKLNFVILDVESDSTVYADEMAEKESRNQFMMAFGGAMQQLSALIQAEPGAAVLAGDLLRFSIAPYRAGRQLDAAIDTFIEQVQQRAGQPQTDPQQEALQAEMQIQQQRLGIEQQKAEAQMAKVQADAQGKQADMQLKMADMQAKAQIQQAEAQTAMQQAQADLAKTAAEVEKLMAEVERIQAETGKAVTETTLAQRNSDIEGARAISDIANSRATTANTIRQSERTVEGQTNGR